MVPLIIKSPVLELKSLLSHLKYGYLGDNNTLPIIIVIGLPLEQDNALLDVLKTHKEAIGWTIADIKGINPNSC